MLIIPSEHAASSRTVDEATWTEMRNFKKSLILMFRAQVQAAASTTLAFWWPIQQMWSQLQGLAASTSSARIAGAHFKLPLCVAVQRRGSSASTTQPQGLHSPAKVL